MQLSRTKNNLGDLENCSPVESRSLWQDAWRRLTGNKAAVVSGFLLLGFIFLVIFGPLLSAHQYDELDFESISSPPALSGHLFGTDGLGRDLFVRTLMGGRISLAVGLIATLVSIVIGVSYGAIAGYCGGKIDAAMMRFVDILYALPFMFFVILLTVVFGRSIVLMFIAIGAVNWLDMARIVRGQTLGLKQKEFVGAARTCGVTSFGIIFRHIVPNLLGLISIYVTLTIPQVILVESFLSFLGLGVQEPETSWGALVSQGTQEMGTAPWSLIFPAVFLTITLFCFNFIGDGLRDALDPKDHT